MSVKRIEIFLFFILIIQTLELSKENFFLLLSVMIIIHQIDPKTRRSW